MAIRCLALDNIESEGEVQLVVRKLLTAKNQEQKESDARDTTHSQEDKLRSMACLPKKQNGHPLAACFFGRNPSSSQDPPAALAASGSWQPYG